MQDVQLFVCMVTVALYIYIGFSLQSFRCRCSDLGVIITDLGGDPFYVFLGLLL